MARIAELQGAIGAMCEGQERMLARVSASSECGGVDPPGARSGDDGRAVLRPVTAGPEILDERAPDRAQSGLFPPPPGRTDAEPEPVSAHARWFQPMKAALLALPERKRILRCRTRNRAFQK
jgi:hypothetical protein